MLPSSVVWTYSLYFTVRYVTVISKNFKYSFLRLVRRSARCVCVYNACTYVQNLRKKVSPLKFQAVKPKLYYLQRNSRIPLKAKDFRCPILYLRYLCAKPSTWSLSYRIKLVCSRDLLSRFHSVTCRSWSVINKLLIFPSTNSDTVVSWNMRWLLITILQNRETWWIHLFFLCRGSFIISGISESILSFDPQTNFSTLGSTQILKHD